MKWGKYILIFYLRKLDYFEITLNKSFVFGRAWQHKGSVCHDAMPVVGNDQNIDFLDFLSIYAREYMQESSISFNLKIEVSLVAKGFH